MCASVLGFMWVLGIQTQVFMLVQEALYHLPSAPLLQFYTSHAEYSSLILLWSIIGVKMLQGIKKQAIKILGPAKWLSREKHLP